MITRFDDRLTEIKEHLKSGEGNVEFKYIASKEQLYNKIKMYSVLTLKQGCSIGYHQHIGEEEIMFIKSGQGDYIDDGKESILKTGDVSICEDGHFHGIKNNSPEVLEIVALIIENV